mgnify:CR=1 FL=1
MKKIITTAQLIFASVLIFSCSSESNKQEVTNNTQPVTAHVDTATTVQKHVSDSTVTKKDSVIKKKEVNFKKIIFSPATDSNELASASDWLKTTINNAKNDYDQEYYTKTFNEFLQDRPDDIMIEMDPNAKKNFKKKWGTKYDCENDGYMHPFTDGNGGCDKLKVISIKCLGVYFNDYYYKTKIKCFMDGNTVDRTFKVIKKNNQFLIDGIYN